MLCAPGVSGGHGAGMQAEVLTERHGGWRTYSLLLMTRRTDGFYRHYYSICQKYVSF